MRNPVNEQAAVVIGTHWYDRRSELAFVTRAVAGAASRRRHVDVLVPGPGTLDEPDGAFDLCGMEGLAERWPAKIGHPSIVVLDETDATVLASLAHLGVGAPFTISGPPVLSSATRPLDLIGQGPGAVGMHVPVNQLASQHRHNGFGFTGYILVLSGRPDSEGAPPPEVAWLTAQFHGLNIVAIDHGTASVWRGRALRGTTSVETRMDLWRLIAHASVCIDLAPGAYVARECVESLRFGTPIIVPTAAAAAASHARAGGGFTFDDVGSLLGAVERLLDTAVHSETAASGRQYADLRYGNPETFVARLNEVLSGAETA